MELSQINAQVEKLCRAFEEFKTTNDNRLKLIEKQGTAGSDREEKLDRIGQDMDKILDRVKAIETAQNRPDAGTELDGKAVDEKVKAQASKAFEKYLRRGERALSTDDFKAMQAVMPEAMKAMSVGTDPDGGYFVSPERSAQITTKVFESSPIRQIASVETIGSNVWEEMADYDEVDAQSTGERTSRSATGTSQLSMLRIPVHEMEANPSATQTLLDDAGVNVEQWLSSKVEDKFARLEGDWFINGDGVTEARGFLTYDHGDGFNYVERVASGTSGSFDADDLISLQDTLYEAFQPGARWVMRRATRSYARTLKDGNGQYLWSIDRGLNNGVQEMLLDKPVTLCPDMPAMGANALAVAYGDFKKGYLIVDRIGIRVLRDPFTSKPYVIFFTTKRVGGGVRQFQAIKLLRLAASTT